MVEHRARGAAVRRCVIIASALLLCGVSACASSDDPVAPRAPAGVNAEPAGQPALPAGWRWESYGGLQVGVPGDWGWGNNSQRLRQWCVGDDGPRGPIVGRTGVTTLVGCDGMDSTPRSETALVNTGNVLGFSRNKNRADHVEHEGDRTTVVLDSVEVEVQAPVELRRQIVATIHRVAVDANGCKSTHPVSDTPQQRPAKPVDLASLTDVTAISACRYRVGPDGYGSPPRLISSIRLEGPTAAGAIRAMAAAPPGTGPNQPGRCAASVRYGDEIIVARTRSSVGLTEIVVRYAGCDHRGIDDGVSVRSLTVAALTPLTRRSNDAFVSLGSSKNSVMVRPDWSTR
jgi:hypothetical protein